MNSICVYCGSSPGGSSDFREAAAGLGALLARDGIRLLYGGGKVGLMGVLADAVLQVGGEVVGVIPRGLLAKEVAHNRLTELRVVESMHERKQVMADLSDGFIALPGGIGTLEETIEVLTWAQLGLHAKPVALLNTAGFFDDLLRLLRRMVSDRFLKPEHFDLLTVSAEPAAVLEKMRTYRPIRIDKWIDRAPGGQEG